MDGIVYSKSQLMQIIENKDNELEWLRYFYKQARYYMGPADDDVYRSILNDYDDSGKSAPVQYYPDFELE